MAYKVVSRKYKHNEYTTGLYTIGIHKTNINAHTSKITVAKSNNNPRQTAIEPTKKMEPHINMDTTKQTRNHEHTKQSRRGLSETFRRCTSDASHKSIGEKRRYRQNPRSSVARQRRRLSHTNKRPTAIVLGTCTSFVDDGYLRRQRGRKETYVLMAAG